MARLWQRQSRKSAATCLPRLEKHHASPLPLRVRGVQGLREFESEVSLLSRLHHPHIVLLIGSCPEKVRPALSV